MPPIVTASPQWVLHPNHSPEAASALARALGSPVVVGHALVNRGIRRESEARDFLEPSLENLHEPSHMLDLDRAVERILAGVAKGERMFVQGDYDVDGITSTFLLTSTLEELGARVEYHIPHRINDGYGLTERSIDEAHPAWLQTSVITVDCITAVEAIAHAQARDRHHRHRPSRAARGAAGRACHPEPAAAVARIPSSHSPAAWPSSWPSNCCAPRRTGSRAELPDGRPGHDRRCGPARG
jgi:hypothetical protein